MQDRNRIIVESRGNFAMAVVGGIERVLHSVDDANDALGELLSCERVCGGISEK